jgi:hypothetical protein
MRDIIFIGDGKGARTYPALTYGLNALGTDISQFAIDNSYCKENMILDDIVNTNLIKLKEYAKVIVLYDILEHLDNKQLDKALLNVIKLTDNIVVSVPVKGDPNLNADKTHKIKQSKEWWIEQFTNKGLKLIKTPDYFLFKEQIMVFRK